MDEIPRPRPVRDEVERPVPVFTALVGLAMFGLHLILDRYADPAQYGMVWGFVQILVEAGVVAGATWWRARVAARRAEAQVTPISDPRVDENGWLVKLVPVPDAAPVPPKGDPDERARRPRRQSWPSQPPE
jgi:hypothetical protein